MLDETYSSLHARERKPGLTDLDASGVVVSDGFDIPYYEVGPADAETTVVFVHGFALSAECFHEQADFLREHYPQVRSLLLDVRGHGLAGAAAKKDCTISGAADDVMTVLAERAKHGRLIIVGHSLGGMITLNLVRRCPSSVFERIDGVVLIGAAIQPLSEKGMAQILKTSVADFAYNMCSRLPRRMASVRREVASFIAPALSVLVAGFPRMESIEFHVAMILDTPLESFVGYFDDLLHHSEIDAAPRLAQLAGVVVLGSSDIITPRSQSEEILEYWPGASLELIDGSGHMVILEKPEEIFAAIRRLL